MDHLRKVDLVGEANISIDDASPCNLIVIYIKQQLVLQKLRKEKKETEMDSYDPNKMDIICGGP